MLSNEKSFKSRLIAEKNDLITLCTLGYFSKEESLVRHKMYTVDFVFSNLEYL